MQIEHLKEAIVEQVNLSSDADLLDFILKLLIAQG